MSKTYRALAVVTIVATLASLALQLTYGLVWVSGWRSFAPLGGSVLAPFIVPLWMTTSALAGPVVGVFSVVVAAQARRWGWLVAFVALSVLCALGPAMIPELELGWAIQVNPTTTVLFGVGFYQALPMIALIFAALIFAAVAGRGQRQAAAGALALAGA